jgi:hypothetical protein
MTEQLTVEEIETRLNEQLQKIFHQFKGREIDGDTRSEFQEALVEMLTEFSKGIGYGNPMDHVEVIVARDDNNPQMLFVNFEPLDPRLRTPRMKIARHVTTGEEGRSPIYCAVVDRNLKISGWGPTPIHAVADLQRNHGAN